MESPSSSPLPSSDLAGDQYEYEAFVSFRGSDTPQSFTDHLYQSLEDAGIGVFRDESDLPTGEESMTALTGLFEAIKQSKVLIPIISTDYASSGPCLMELVLILECWKTMGRAIIPIFYDVEPSDLRHQNNSIRESFLELEGRGVDSETIEKWKRALQELGSIIGFVAANVKGHHSRLIDELIPIVLQKLIKGRLTVPKDLVGVDHHVQEIMGKLGVVHRGGQVSDVQILGIYGAGGVGKTTVAKVVYNQLYDRFECHSYLKEVREFCQNDGNVSLQNQLISDLLEQRVRFTDSHVAMVFLAARFCSKRVIILLDDVEDVDQLDMVVGKLSWFGPGSIIIVTSRKSNILSKFKEAETYEVKPMEDDEALQLFSKRAFETDSPSKGFEDLSRDIILATGRIPLALEVTGSLLFGKPQVIWTEMLKELKSTPHEKVKEQVDHLLEMSYDALEENAKKTFLAIACFEIYMWEDSKLDSIEVLVVMSLVKIGENKELLMHDRVRTLGRKIVSNEDPIPRNQSGPWVHNEALSTPWKEKKCEELELPNSPFESLGTSFATIEHVIGIDDRVKEVIKFLQIEDVGKLRMVGIHGTSGIGKTTIAKAVYDRLSSCFDSCCFLAEIGQTTQNVGGFQFVQTKLISDILKRDVDVASFEGGIKFFQKVFGNIKALIILDDVEEQSHLDDLVGDQLDWFGSGSRIIVTTENREILQTYVSRGLACIYDVNKMGTDRAFELFCKHALGTHGSISDYPEIGNRIIKATWQIPLVIEVIGSFLRGKTIEDWSEMEKSIKPRTEDSREILKDCGDILKICYEVLDKNQKQIFWDIAWFANGVDSRIASYMWPDRHSLPSHQVLMPLAKIGEDNMLGMHKLLKRLSRTIDQEEPKYPVKRRRLDMDDPDLKVINKNEGTEEVESPCFDFKNLHPHTFTETFPNVRFLKLDRASMTENFANVFPKLRWLRWHGCLRDFVGTEFSLMELVILDLSWSKVTEDWRGWELIKMEQLKVLNLSGCTDLLISPTFSSFPNLEILILERCSRFVHLEPSVGGLKKFLCLNLKSCTKLNRLPAELGALKSLKELLIDETSVRDIPLGGDLKDLEIISASNCLSLSLPDGVGELVKLRRLSFRNCRLIRKLP